MCESHIDAENKKELLKKYDVFNLVKKSGLNTKLVKLATKVELKTEQDKIVKLEVFDSRLFVVKFFWTMMVLKIYLFIN